MFWIAIITIDRCYYNRLLIGSVIALRAIEARSGGQNPNLAINISTQIEHFTAHPFSDKDSTFCEKVQRKLGVWIFYIIVLVALILLLPGIANAQFAAPLMCVLS
jgi:hypothetical protein